MKKILFISSFVMLLLHLTSCRKNDTVAEPPTNTTTHTKGKVTAKGAPVGTAVTKTIGSSGGTITSADNAISITVPAGAVSSSTPFSIQPVENNAPNGVGLAYRLLPEGTLFSKPVDITFRYTDDMIQGSAPELLWAAYQNAEGIWKAQRKTVVNQTAKTATVSTVHFSDWTLFEGFILKAERPVLEPNENTLLRVTGIRLLGSLEDVEGDVDEITNLEKVSNWKLFGGGTLAPNSTKAIYTAPSTTPSPNPVQISAEISNIETNQGTKAKVIVFASVFITNSYMQVTLDGAKYLFTNVNATTTGQTIVVSGGDGLLNNIMLNVALTGPGTKSFTVNVNPQTFAIAFINGNALASYYDSCNPSATVTTSGSISISRFGNIGEDVEGTFQGQLAVADGQCSPTLKSISGKFHFRRG